MKYYRVIPQVGFAAAGDTAGLAAHKNPETR